MAGGRIYSYSSKSTQKKKSTKKKPIARAKGIVTKNVNNARLNRMLGIPLISKARLRYAETFSVNQPAPYHQQFRLNSLFDPDFTGGGHQPLQFDQYHQWYKSYLVTDCTATIMITQTNTTDFPVLLTYAVRNDQIISALSIKEALEQGNRSVMQLGYAGSGSSAKTMTRSASVAKYYGTKSVKPTDDHFVGLTGGIGVGSNPADWVVGTVSVYRGDDSSSNVSFVMTVVLDFKCQFFGQKEIAES